MAPAAEGHPDDDHKKSHGGRSHSSHNPDSGQQVYGEDRECSDEAKCEAQEEPGNRDSELAWVGFSGFKRSPSLGIPKFVVPSLESFQFKGI